ncbi:7598_t:CDS:10 [Diversispora eburnea]|uniref:DNA-directed RNA polymerases I and III subunit RPAC1 n=1 Tax=Diversispora eburnea TaxID=1213867 RepID=A0A9N9A5H6_9GLOM|nr:7598_t:CDS:10 [Diversispora eburnea]
MSHNRSDNAERLEQLRTRVKIDRDGISSSDFPFHSSNAYPEFDSIEIFRKKLKIKVIKKSQFEMEFDLIGIDAAIANALRRVMIAEVLYIYDNTSIIQDEVLAHRLGLIPIKVDPDLFYFKHENERPTDMNTIVFKINHECRYNPKVRDDESDPKQLYIGHNLLSSSLIWDPKGEQAERFTDNPIKPVHDDILIAQMRPGQRMELEAHSTATYRLMPEIIIKEEITGDLADKFAACFSKVNNEMVKTVKVVNPRLDTVSREVLQRIFIDAIHIMQTKCSRLLLALENKLKELEDERNVMSLDDV